MLSGSRIDSSLGLGVILKVQVSEDAKIALQKVHREVVVAET